VLLSEIKSEPKLLERNPLLPSGVLLRSGEERGGVEKERERDRSEDALSRDVFELGEPLREGRDKGRGRRGGFRELEERRPGRRDEACVTKRRLSVSD
jgi:hypothetical protein